MVTNQPKVIHVFTDYTPSDPETVRRNRVAQSTWTRQPWVACPVRDEQLPRLHPIPEHGKKLAYLKDVWDWGTKHAEDNDIVIYTNSDISVRSDCCEQVMRQMDNTDACYCFRRDFSHQFDKPIPDADIEKGVDYAGSDLFAWRAIWWKVYRDEFPDMVLGLELWDALARALMEMTNSPGTTCCRNLIYHQRHNSFWERPEHRYKLPSQLLMLSLGRQWAVKHGLNYHKWGVP